MPLGVTVNSSGGTAGAGAYSPAGVPTAETSDTAASSTTLHFSNMGVTNLSPTGFASTLRRHSVSERRLAQISRWVLIACAVMLAACSSAPKAPCGPSNCAGCCEDDGVCTSGLEFAGCGTGGAKCDPCLPLQQCVMGACIDAPRDGGQDGGVVDPNAELTAVRAAADADAGAVSLPVDGVLVSYLKPLVQDAGPSDPAGFFVQAGSTGPGLFVAIDPSTVAGGPLSVGDLVSFTVTAVTRAGSVREATSLSALSRSSSGNPVNGLAQSVSNVAFSTSSSIDTYESTLITLSGQVSSSSASAGSGYRGSALSTSGTPAAADGGSPIQLRLPTALALSEDLTPGCQLSVGPTPLWRFNARAQPLAFIASELSAVSCPAPTVVAARATSDTQVLVIFDRTLDATTVTTPAFTIAGLGVTVASQFSPRQTQLTTAAQTPGMQYTVTVASSVTDTRGTGVNAMNNAAVFTGFVADSGSDGGAPVDGGDDGGSPADGGSDGGGPADGGGNDAGSCGIGHVVISEVRSRGAGGASDEFIELYNPTAAAVVLDSTWTLNGRSTAAPNYTVRYLGDGGSIPAHGHFLIAGTTYTELPTPDGTLAIGVTDATSLTLQQNGATLDAVCFAFDSTTTATLQGVGYTCSGTPVSNLPHDNTNSTSSNADVSVERKPGGTAGNCTLTGDNSADFVTQMPATPLNASSPPTP